MIDLYDPTFWAFVAVAVGVLVPMTRPGARRWALALINLGFLGQLLNWSGAALDVILIGIPAAWLGLRAMSGRGRRAMARLGGLAVLALFAIHKRPDLAADLGLGRLNPTLAGPGFSYVALRLVEVGRAVYERRQPPPGPAEMVNYLLPFHMLAAGPIQSYDDFVARPGVPDPLGAGEALGAIERIASGLFKKYILAATIESVFLSGFRAGWPYDLAEMQLNYLWLFLDFSAYSDIAAGVGRLMGVATPENFNRPYLARNVIDYWDRWHISLSQFIRRNVFIPIQLALMRRTDGRHPLGVASVAFAVSFLLCGLWHSLSWRWLAWGAYNASGLVACNLYKSYLLRRLGRKGWNRYLANPWIRAASVAATYEFVAFSLVLVAHPLEGVSSWLESSR